MLSPIWALVLAVFAVGVDLYVVVGILPAISDELGEPVAAVALLASAYALPTALFAPVSGPLSDRRGRRLAMQVGLVVFIASAAARSIAPDLRFLLIARAVNGFGAAIILPAAFAYAGDIPRLEERNKAIGLVASALPLAALLGVPLGALVATLAGWRSVFVFITIVGMVALILVRVLLTADKVKTVQPLGYIASYRTVLSDRGALRLLLVQFVWFIAPFGLLVLLAEFIHVTYDIPATQAGLFLLVFGAVGVVASRLSGRFMAVVGPRNAVLIAIIVFSSAVALMPLSSSALPLTLLVMALWAGGSWFGQPAMQAIVAAHSENLRGTMLAFNSSAMFLAGVIGPVVFGVIVAASSISTAFWMGALFGVGAFVVAWIMLPRPRAVPAADPG
jgi:predicted MFS family arabinose efflux permease